MRWGGKGPKLGSTVNEAVCWRGRSAAGYTTDIRCEGGSGKCNLNGHVKEGAFYWKWRRAAALFYGGIERCSQTESPVKLNVEDEALRLYNVTTK